jgi:hypothetical protein
MRIIFEVILMNGSPRRVRHSRIVRGSTPISAAAVSSVSICPASAGESFDAFIMPSP